MVNYSYFYIWRLWFVDFLRTRFPKYTFYYYNRKQNKRRSSHPLKKPYLFHLLQKNELFSRQKKNFFKTYKYYSLRYFLKFFYPSHGTWSINTYRYSNFLHEKARRHRRYFLPVFKASRRRHSFARSFNALLNYNNKLCNFFLLSSHDFVNIRDSSLNNFLFPVKVYYPIKTSAPNSAKNYFFSKRNNWRSSITHFNSLLYSFINLNNLNYSFLNEVLSSDLSTSSLDFAKLGELQVLYKFYENDKVERQNFIQNYNDTHMLSEEFFELMDFIEKNEINDDFPKAIEEDPRIKITKKDFLKVTQYSITKAMTDEFSKILLGIPKEQSDEPSALLPGTLEEQSDELNELGTKLIRIDITTKNTATKNTATKTEEFPPIEINFTDEDDNYIAFKLEDDLIFYLDFLEYIDNIDDIDFDEYRVMIEKDLKKELYKATIDEDYLYEDTAMDSEEVFYELEYDNTMNSNFLNSNSDKNFLKLEVVDPELYEPLELLDEAEQKMYQQFLKTTFPAVKKEIYIDTGLSPVKNTLNSGTKKNEKHDTVNKQLASYAYNLDTPLEVIDEDKDYSEQYGDITSLYKISKKKNSELDTEKKSYNFLLDNFFNPSFSHIFMNEHLFERIAKQGISQNVEKSHFQHDFDPLWTNNFYRLREFRPGEKRIFIPGDLSTMRRIFRRLTNYNVYAPTLNDSYDNSLLSQVHLVLNEKLLVSINFLLKLNNYEQFVVYFYKNFVHDLSLPSLLRQFLIYHFRYMNKKHFATKDQVYQNFIRALLKCKTLLTAPVSNNFHDFYKKQTLIKFLQSTFSKPSDFVTLLRLNKANVPLSFEQKFFLNDFLFKKIILILSRHLAYEDAVEFVDTIVSFLQKKEKLPQDLVAFENFVRLVANQITNKEINLRIPQFPVEEKNRFLARLFLVKFLEYYKHHYNVLWQKYEMKKNINNLLNFHNNTEDFFNPKYYFMFGHPFLKNRVKLPEIKTLLANNTFVFLDNPYKYLRPLKEIFFDPAPNYSTNLFYLPRFRKYALELLVTSAELREQQCLDMKNLTESIPFIYVDNDLDVATFSILHEFFLNNKNLFFLKLEDFNNPLFHAALTRSYIDQYYKTLVTNGKDSYYLPNYLSFRFIQANNEVFDPVELLLDEFDIIAKNKKSFDLLFDVDSRRFMERLFALSSQTDERFLYKYNNSSNYYFLNKIRERLVLSLYAEKSFQDFFWQVKRFLRYPYQKRIGVDLYSKYLNTTYYNDPFFSYYIGYKNIDKIRQDSLFIPLNSASSKTSILKRIFSPVFSNETYYFYPEKQTDFYALRLAFSRFFSMKPFTFIYNFPFSFSLEREQKSSNRTKTFPSNDPVIYFFLKKLNDFVSWFDFFDYIKPLYPTNYYSRLLRDEIMFFRPHLNKFSIYHDQNFFHPSAREYRLVNTPFNFFDTSLPIKFILNLNPYDYHLHFLKAQPFYPYMGIAPDNPYLRDLEYSVFRTNFYNFFNEVQARSQSRQTFLLLQEMLSKKLDSSKENNGKILLPDIDKVKSLNNVLNFYLKELTVSEKIFIYKYLLTSSALQRKLNNVLLIKQLDKKNFLVVQKLIKTFLVKEHFDSKDFLNKKAVFFLTKAFYPRSDSTISVPNNSKVLNISANTLIPNTQNSSYRQALRNNAFYKGSYISNVIAEDKKLKVHFFKNNFVLPIKFGDTMSKRISFFKNNWLPTTSRLKKLIQRREMLNFKPKAVFGPRPYSWSWFDELRAMVGLTTPRRLKRQELFSVRQLTSHELEQVGLGYLTDFYPLLKMWYYTTEPFEYQRLMADYAFSEEVKTIYFYEIPLFYHDFSELPMLNTCSFYSSEYLAYSHTWAFTYFSQVSITLLAGAYALLLLFILIIFFMHNFLWFYTKKMMLTNFRFSFYKEHVFNMYKKLKNLLFSVRRSVIPIISKIFLKKDNFFFENFFEVIFFGPIKRVSNFFLSRIPARIKNTLYAFYIKNVFYIIPIVVPIVLLILF